MLKRHRLAELAPRDVVARAIFREQGGRPAGLSRRAKAGTIVRRPVSGYLRDLPRARNRSVEGSHSGDAGCALHDGRDRHRPSRAIQPESTVCVRRGFAHRRAWGEPIGVELAARGVGVRGAGGARHDRSRKNCRRHRARRAGTFPSLRDRGAAQVAADSIRQVMWDYCGIDRTRQGSEGVTREADGDRVAAAGRSDRRDEHGADVAADRGGGVAEKGIARRTLSKRFSPRQTQVAVESTSNGRVDRRRCTRSCRKRSSTSRASATR